MHFYQLFVGINFGFEVKVLRVKAVSLFNWSFFLHASQNHLQFFLHIKSKFAFSHHLPFWMTVFYFFLILRFFFTLPLPLGFLLLVFKIGKQEFMSLVSFILEGCLSPRRRFLINHGKAELFWSHNVLRFMIRDRNFRRCITHHFCY